MHGREIGGVSARYDSGPNPRELTSIIPGEHTQDVSALIVDAVLNVMVELRDDAPFSIREPESHGRRADSNPEGRTDKTNYE